MKISKGYLSVGLATALLMCVLATTFGRPVHATTVKQGDDNTNHSVHPPHEASTHGAPSATILGAHAQDFSQKDEARSKGQITLKGELLSATDSRLIQVGMNKLPSGGRYEYSSISLSRSLGTYGIGAPTA